MFTFAKKQHTLATNLTRFGDPLMVISQNLPKQNSDAMKHFNNEHGEYQSPVLTVEKVYIEQGFAGSFVPSGDHEGGGSSYEEED